MHQGRFEALDPAPDDVRPSGASKSPEINVDPTERGMSIAAGGLLLLCGLRRGSLPLVLGGGALLYRGASGNCPLYRALESSRGASLKRGLQVEETITVHKAPEEVYALWRRLEDLPRFMSHLESVTALNDRQSHWVAKLPAPFRLEWNATIIDDQENRRISWQSLPGSSIHHTGSVFFHAVPARNSTEVKVIFSYHPPAGSAGAAIAKLFETLTEHQIREDLRAFKAVVETGEKPTIAGQPSGRVREEPEKSQAHRLPPRIPIATLLDTRPYGGTEDITLTKEEGAT